MSVIDLDSNATTRPDVRVVEAVAEAMRLLGGNPASHHVLGRQAHRAVEDARSQVAGAMGCARSRVVFTSGATEANNIAIMGTWLAAQAAGTARRRVIVGATEHPSVLEPARELAAAGAEVVELPVDGAGLPDLEVLGRQVNEQTLLVSLMGANNETGVLAPIAEVARVAHVHGALFHTDLTQMVGRVPVDVYDIGADLASMSGHKFHGPKGVGALFVDGGIPIQGVYRGGGQERDLRPGTLNVPGIVGLGQACVLVSGLLGQSAQVKDLRDLLVARIRSEGIAVTVNGDGAPRLTNTANLWFAGIDGEALVATTPGVAFSTGSACSSSVPHASHVLTAMGLTDDEASECVRFSLSVHTTEADVVHASTRVVESARRLHGLVNEGVA